MKGFHYYDLRCFIQYAFWALFLAIAAYFLCDLFLVSLRANPFTLIRFGLFGLVLFWAMIALHYETKKNQEQIIKGSTLLTPKQFNRIIKGKGVGIPTLSSALASKLFYLRVRQQDERKHILLCGDTGSGKSAIQHYLLHQILCRKTDSLVIYDPSLEFWQAHGRPEEDILLYPLAEQCPYWSLIGEIRAGEYSKVDAQKLAESMIPDRDEGRVDFWDEAPREILSFLLLRLKQEGGSNRDLITWLKDRELLFQMIEGTGLESIIDPQAPQQRAGVLSKFGKIVNVLEMLPDNDGSRIKFSISKWAKNRKGNIFIGTRGLAERKSLRPLISTWLDTIFARLMLKIGGPPVWCFVDELPTLERLPSLKDAIQESRKYNLRFVLGFQGRSQLEQRYGREAESLMSAPELRIFLKTSEPKAAEWIANNIGKPRKQQQQLSLTKPLLGIGRELVNSRTEERTDYLVYPNEIQTLGEREGYLGYDKYAVRIQFPYPQFLTVKNQL